MKPDPALDLVLLQTKQNILFLVSQGVLDKDDVALILGKLDLSATSFQTDAQQFSTKQSPAAASAQPCSRGEETPTNEPPRYSEKIPSNMEEPAQVLPTGVPLFAVKARWAYNEDGKAEKDLSFRSGDVIEIIEQSNADWWLGRFRGREGLLPSTYVEKLPDPPPSRPTSVSMGLRPVSPPYPGAASPLFPTPGGFSYPGGPSYAQASPYYPSSQRYSAPPLPHGGYTPPPGAAQAQQSDNLRRHRFTNTGNGAGFGAGNAAGSGIIHSIF